MRPAMMRQGSGTIVENRQQRVALNPVEIKQCPADETPIDERSEVLLMRIRRPEQRVWLLGPTGTTVEEFGRRWRTAGHRDYADASIREHRAMGTVCKL